MNKNIKYLIADLTLFININTWLSKRNGGTLCCLLSKLSKLASRGPLLRVESRSKDIDRFDTVLRLLSLQFENVYFKFQIQLL